MKMRRMMEMDSDANMLTHRFPIMFTPLQHRKLLACQANSITNSDTYPMRVTPRHSKMISV